MNESLMWFGLGVAFIVGLALYMDCHRLEERDKREGGTRRHE